MGEWRKWTGGESPVPGFVVVDVELRDGSTDSRAAEELYWDYAIPRGDQIVRWREATPTTKPRSAK